MIRQVTVEELPRMERCARGFYAAAKSLKKFDLECFVCFWKGLIEAGAGVIFGLFDGEEIIGTIGGMASYEPNDAVIATSEAFWWVEPEYRRGTNGMRLYYELEKWARDKNSQSIRMVHLEDSMPETMAGIYERMGFAKIETHYSKDL